MTLDKRCEGIDKNAHPSVPQPAQSSGLQAALEQFTRIQREHHQTIEDLHLAFADGLRQAYRDDRIEIRHWQVNDEYGVQVNIDAPAQEMDGLLTKHGARRDTTDSTRLKDASGNYWGELSNPQFGAATDRIRYRLAMTSLAESQAPGILGFIDGLFALYGIQRTS